MTDESSLDDRADDPPFISVLAFAGSLRRDSYNAQLIATAIEMVPKNVSIECFDIGDIPLFNEDVEAEGDPRAVVAFKEAIADADALLIATPEYQHGLPGVLKNALDWASRPADSSVMRDKVAAIMGATPGTGGTVRAQVQLRQTLEFTNTRVVLQPEVLVADAEHAFDGGRLTDPDGCQFLGELLDELVALARVLQPVMT